MAKRYKRKENKKWKIFLFFFIIIIIIGIIILWQKNNNLNENKVIETEIENVVLQEIVENIRQNNDILSSDLLVPKEICIEIEEILKSNIENGSIIKINYQLKSLEEGNLFLYYKLGENNIVKIEIDIASKMIQNISNYNESDLDGKSVIKENLNENIKKDFENNKSKLENDNNRLNIIITNTEIIINIVWV